MSFLIFSCSLNPNSRSRVLARAAQTRLEAAGVDVEFVDLQNCPLPLCDGASAYGDPLVAELSRKIADAEGVLIAVPIYNFAVNAAAKNLIELTGNAWREKIVGFLCSAGSTISFTSVMTFANSLMLDFRSVIVPRFVYATEADIDGGRIIDPRLHERIEEVTSTLIRFARALNPVPHDS
ncbi:MAG: NAD(P)H-dependent oxidoreductase [Candidatus Hydrogenedentes bacterium]|nr:NAD(P)H-dependent oxidoreductase [Candidatus Hydrogenedentota bacterium]